MEPSINQGEAKFQNINQIVQSSDSGEQLISLEDEQENEKKKEDEFETTLNKQQTIKNEISAKGDSKQLQSIEKQVQFLKELNIKDLTQQCQTNNKSQNQKPSQLKRRGDNKIKKQKHKKEKLEDSEWTVNSAESDNDQVSKFIEDDEKSNQYINESAVMDEKDIHRLTNDQLKYDANEAEIEKSSNLHFQHWVQSKHLLVLYLLFRSEIFSMFPKGQSKRIDIHPINKNKIRIHGSNNEQIKQICAKLSEIINQISIIKLNIRNDEARRLKSSKILNQKLLKDKIIIFQYGYSQDKNYYLGGKGTQAQLSFILKEIRNLKFRYFRLSNYRNTRTYRTILAHIISQKQFTKQFSKWGVKNIQIVPYIPNSNYHGSKNFKQKSLCFLMTTIGNTDNLSPKQIEINISKFVKLNYYSIVLIFKKGQKYLPKIGIEGIFFKYLFQQRFSWAYLIIICQKKKFFHQRNQIILEIQKLSNIAKIYGMRYFDHLEPEIPQFYSVNFYKKIKYPQQNPYSSSIIARRVIKQVTNKKKEIKQNQNSIKQTEEKEWYQFNWKQFILYLNDPENLTEFRNK